ncbi:MAG TPA: HAD family phosphatase [Acidimicrobiales bacterium]|nr:HAD family phosphatase [Acidimicrobiales bacterium]
MSATDHDPPGVPDRTIDAVLFDFGGVFTLSPFDTVAAAGKELGLDEAVAFDLCFGPYDQDGDHPWHRLERGELSLIDARQALAEMARGRGFDVDPLALLIGQRPEDDQRDEVVARALRVRASGVATACVTNNVAEFGEAWRSMIPVDDLFDVIVDSCRAGVRKPDARMFELALAELSVRAERAVFLDDHPSNVAAAARLGIRSILVGPDRVAAFDELDVLVGLASGTARCAGEGAVCAP